MNHSERTEAWNEAKKQDVAQRKLAWERHQTEQSGIPVQVLDDQRIQNDDKNNKSRATDGAEWTKV